MNYNFIILIWSVGFISLIFEITFINGLSTALKDIKEKKPTYTGKLSEEIRIFQYGLKESRFKEYTKRRIRNLVLNSVGQVLIILYCIYFLDYYWIPLISFILFLFSFIFLTLGDLITQKEEIIR
ncbi:hypothetical protein [Lederbergia citri]|uniref:Uncharacterized protein n=1 Tax=Lederbergia citri TaxID=2833580 RepID=A0A942TAQ7_9BACI|nr:hypothetical protein [Lederbergia citri]MBS4194318.1 hypothetical protein [Lederbergia citri]